MLTNRKQFTICTTVWSLEFVVFGCYTTNASLWKRKWSTLTTGSTVVSYLFALTAVLWYSVRYIRELAGSLLSHTLLHAVTLPHSTFFGSSSRSLQLRCVVIRRY